MSDDASADGDCSSSAINDLFKHDHGISQARRKARKAEVKCRLMLKRALKQGDVRFCNSCISSFANDGMLGLALVIVREVFEKGKFKPSECVCPNPIRIADFLYQTPLLQVHSVKRCQRVRPLQRN